MSTPETVIEFVDPSGKSGPAHVASGEILINGVPVLVEKDGADIEWGPNEATIVTLRLLPSRVVFGRGETRGPDLRRDPERGPCSVRVEVREVGA